MIGRCFMVQELVWLLGRGTWGGVQADVCPLSNVRTGFCWELLAPMTGMELC